MLRLEMLECDKFKCKGALRGPIYFNMGLNSILGGEITANSIGKSTLLRIIDFVLAKRIPDSSLVKILEKADVKFIFKSDNNETFYFIRNLGKSNFVKSCDEKFKELKTISLQDYEEFLIEKYEMGELNLNFRHIVSPFIRIGQENNTKPRNILESDSAGHNQKDDALNLEKIFGLYSQINEYEQDVTDKQTMLEEYKKSRKAQLLPSDAIQTKQEKKLFDTKLVKLKAELKKFQEGKNYEVLKTNLYTGKESAALASKIDNYEEHHKIVLAQIERTRQYKEGCGAPSENDFAELKKFFPDTDVRALQEVQSFHKKITSILFEEMNREKERLEQLDAALVNEIQKLEKKKAQLGTPSNIPIEDFQKFATIYSQISLIEAQFETDKNIVFFREACNNAVKKYKEIVNSAFSSIEVELNKKIKETYLAIMNKRSSVPLFKLSKDSRYSYTNKSDEGDQAANKSVLAFDISILNLTKIPFVIHDSNFFVGIEKDQVERILLMYSRIKNKQVFIAFSDLSSFSETSKKILHGTKVIELGPGDKSLLGKSLS